MLVMTRRRMLEAGVVAGAFPRPNMAQIQGRGKPAKLLSESWGPEKLAAALLPREKWEPFPSASDRLAWDRLPPDVKQGLISAAERHGNQPWPILPASVFLQYARTGDRAVYEGIRSARRERLRELVIAECVEGKGRFLDEVLNGVWATCEETYWGVPAHLGLQKVGIGLPDVTEPTVDLFTGETASLLAWTDYLLGSQLDRISPLIRHRIRLEINRRMLTPNLERVDFWWMGLDPKLTRTVNNWNPWINSNWLASTLLTETNPERRIQSVYKILCSLDRFLDGYHADGGCDEGPSYWGRAGGSLFDCLELLYSASEGIIQFYDQPLIREIGRYIYRAHIYNDYFVNFADAPARLRLNGDLVFRYGRRIGDEKMQALGAFAASQHGGSTRGDSIGRQLHALFNLQTLSTAPAWQPLTRDVWLPGIQVMAARMKERSASGLYLAAKGGHNAESHNHNDVGNFIVYADGQPVLIDVGVETYTAKTFSSQRYEIWTMQSAYHNLPTIGGIMQNSGRQFAARDVHYMANDRMVEFSLDISQAYPPQTGLKYWRRTLRLDREKNEIELAESWGFAQGGRDIMWTLMTPCAVSLTAPGEIILAVQKANSATVRLIYDAASVTPSVEEINISDPHLRSSWGQRIYRIVLRTTAASRSSSTWSLHIAQSSVRESR
jgi:hypothetical protein